MKVKFEMTFLTQHLVLSIFTQIWVQTTQHCLECGIQPCHAPIKQFPAQSFKCTVTGMSCMFT